MLRASVSASPRVCPHLPHKPAIRLACVPPFTRPKEGNFDAFVMAKGIKADDIEALLSGNLTLDEAGSSRVDLAELRNELSTAGSSNGWIRRFSRRAVVCA